MASFMCKHFRHFIFSPLFFSPLFCFVVSLLLTAQNGFAEEFLPTSDSMVRQGETVGMSTCYNDSWEDRQRARSHDPWFALDPTSCESYFGGSYVHTVLNSAITPGWDLYGGGYITLFGLEVRYNSAFDNRWFGQFNFRAYGSHDQGNTIIFQAGMRSVDSSSLSYRNAYAGASGTLYLTRGLGITALYRHFFPSTPTPSGSISGDRYELGPFLDFRFVRLYGNYFNDVETSAIFGGLQFGIKLWF